MTSDRNRAELSRPAMVVHKLAENSVTEQRERRIPIVEERARIEKTMVERGVVSITTSVKETEQLIADALRHQEVDIQHVSIDSEVDSIPRIRQDGDVIVIPIVEERAVIVKRLFLVEELHVRVNTVEETVNIPVVLQSTEVSVERKEPDSNP